ncbi:hypothetical protein PI124_g8902 [Phytophthora idaei]|nr:hypothetical protein PI125_g13128 [Phytophthora idaei]KAG3149135.1 hypothetical protein PI126_g12157 [Phytophthora idaei]KAG3246384.1 hypothetical protein PI124_g8902 [Phytophthora idaei]
MDLSATKQSPTSSASTPPKAKSGDSTDSKNDEKEPAKLEDKKPDEHRLSAHGYSHQHLHNRRPFHHEAHAPSSSPAAPHGSSTPAKSVTISDRVTTSSPRGGHSSTSTPTRPTDGSGNHHVVNPILEKMREAQRESHRAYLKSSSDYNRAEMKYVSIEAELRLAEFWLEVVTKNLEDVGKRIEVHDWNFQKITNQDESDVA